MFHADGRKLIKKSLCSSFFIIFIIRLLLRNGFSYETHLKLRKFQCGINEGRQAFNLISTLYD